MWCEVDYCGSNTDALDNWWHGHEEDRTPVVVHLCKGRADRCRASFKRRGFVTLHTDERCLLGPVSLNMRASEDGYLASRRHLFPPEELGDEEAGDGHAAMAVFAK